MVPQGTYTMMGHEPAVGISKLQLRIEGTISAWNNATQWPNDGKKYYPLVGME